jgi:adenosylcobinamide-phosphate guanylyltransferase
LKVTALVMAGGQGKRLALSEEKPLLQICGRPIIEYVLDALKQARKIDSIAVAVSPFTTNTAEHLKNSGVRVIKTPGNDYVYDMGYAVRKLGLGITIVLASDLPLITGEIIDDVVTSFEHCKQPALTAIVPMRTKEKLGLTSEYSFKLDDQIVVPAGINVIDGKRIDDKELEQTYCLIDLDAVALNINTVEDLKRAKQLLEKLNSKKE